MFPNWLNEQISNDIFTNKYVKVGFSQNGEDDFIRGFFWDSILSKKPGTYLDIGCYHDSLYSNTKLLSLVGWKGVAVDANPELRVIWEKNRPHDKFFNYGIIQKSGSDRNAFNFYRFEDGAINTFSKRLAVDWVKRGFRLRDVLKIYSIDLIRLGEIINDQMPGFRPNFLSIDIEQVDYLSELKEFITLLKHPDLLCLEWINQGYHIDNYKESKEYHVLEECGYKVDTLLGGNIFASKHSDDQQLG